MTKIIPIPNFSNYGASVCGSIWRVTPCPQRGWREEHLPKRMRIKLRLGYPHVSLVRDDGVRKFLKVSRLVLLAHVGPAPKGTECAHWDGEKTNSRLDNLRWATRLENIADMARHGRLSLGSKNGRAKLDLAQVRKIRAALAKGGMTQKQIAASFKISQAQVSNIATGKKWRHTV